MDLTGDPVLIGLQITMTGIIVVFSALALVALTLVALGQLNRFQGKSKAKSELTSQTTVVLPKPAAALPDGQITPELIAVLSAAAAEMLGGRVRVTRVEYDRRPGADVWARRGRVAIMDSRRRR